MCSILKDIKKCQVTLDHHLSLHLVILFWIHFNTVFSSFICTLLSLHSPEVSLFICPPTFYNTSHLSHQQLSLSLSISPFHLQYQREGAETQTSLLSSCERTPKWQQHLSVCVCFILYARVFASVCKSVYAMCVCLCIICWRASLLTLYKFNSLKTLESET